ncbi:MAG: hypothetical protein ACJ78X_03525, partial [Myxococcales bacterium]
MQRKIMTMLAGTALAAAAAFGCLHHGDALAAPNQNAATVATSSAAALPDFSGIVQRYGPAVVNVSVTGTAKAAYPGEPQLDPDDPFSQFFHRFQG